MVELRKRPQLVLVASQGEWAGRSVESVLELNGYNCIRVEGGRRALELARSTHPDALILDTALSELTGVEVCRGLVDDPLFDHSTPIILTSPAPASNRMRAEAYEAGAWDFCTQPLDVETLLLKMRTFLRARRRAEAAQSISLIDPLTGLYSAFGLRHWAETLGARASRNHEPFACVAVASMQPSMSTSAERRGARSSSAALNNLADVCRANARKSDVIGYVGENRFAILAPDTDSVGARRFVGRLQHALDEMGGAEIPGAHPALHAGFYAAADFGSAHVEPAEVVRRAETALQFALLGSGTEGTMSFDDLEGTG